MIHRGLLFWSVVAVATAIGLFSVKYKVQDLEEQIDRTNQKIIESQQATHILKIEWAHLNEAARLERLAQKYLNLQETSIGQVARLETLKSLPGPAASATPPAPSNKTADQQRRDPPLPSPPRTGTDVPSSIMPGGGRASAEAGSPSPASAPAKAPPRGTSARASAQLLSDGHSTGSTTPPQPARSEPAAKGPVGDGQIAATSIDEILSRKEGERR